MSTKLPPIPYGSPPGSSYWNDWYEKMRSIINGITGSYVSSFNGRTGVVALTSPDVTTALGYIPGTVSSVAATVPSIFSISGSPITTSGTLTITYSGLALPVINGGTGTTTSTGTGSVVLSSSPTLITPALGTPSTVTLTNAIGLPISTGVSGLGTGVATFLATPSSANLAAAVTDETGSGALVFASSPALAGTPTAPTAAAGTNTTQIATTAFVATALTLPSWTAPTLINSWVNFGAGFNNAGYYKDPFGVVHLRGFIKDGTSGSVMFVLPAGSRPTNSEVFAAAANSAFATLLIDNAGNVTHNGGSTTWFSLDGVTFRAA